MTKLSNFIPEIKIHPRNFNVAEFMNQPDNYRMLVGLVGPIGSKFTMIDKGRAIAGPEDEEDGYVNDEYGIEVAFNREDLPYNENDQENRVYKENIGGRDIYFLNYLNN